MSRPSLRAAIDAKCKSCIYDPGSGNGSWREQVQACSSANCPLHPLRPLSRSKMRGDCVGLYGMGDERPLGLHGPKSSLPGPAFSISEGAAA